MTNQASTAVAPRGMEEQLGHIPSDDEIEGIRKAGAQVAAYKKEVKKIYQVIEGLEWGSGSSAVKGSSLSPQTRYAMAEFCRITRANPQYHVDVLGGKPYLNANYWEDLINSHPLFHHYEQREISKATEDALRQRALRHRELAQELEAAGDAEGAARRRAKAFDIEEEAEDIAMARAHWDPRETATAVVETTIYRFMNQAPIEAIQRGEIEDFEKYLIAVSECNWAGGMGRTMADAKKFDPIGDANPSTTARTRSLRRAATKSFSAWMQQYDRQIQKAEQAIEAEWEIVQEDKRQERASLPSSDGPQAVSTSNGEPEAANPNGARPLPVDGEEAPEQAPDTAPKKAGDQTSEPEWDPTDARKRLFATLRAAGIEGDARKTWALEHGLPESTKQWGPAEYDLAQDLLVGPTRRRVEDGAEVLGIDLADLSLQELGKDRPEYLKDWQELEAAIRARADGKADR